MVRMFGRYGPNMTEGQIARLAAGFAGCVVRTAGRYLRGETVKGAELRGRLEDAVRRVESIAAEKDQATPDAPRVAA